jgi:hypothetical protein
LLGCECQLICFVGANRRFKVGGSSRFRCLRCLPLSDSSANILEVGSRSSCTSPVPESLVWPRRCYWSVGRSCEATRRPRRDSPESYRERSIRSTVQSRGLAPVGPDGGDIYSRSHEQKLEGNFGCMPGVVGTR